MKETVHFTIHYPVLFKSTFCTTVTNIAGMKGGVPSADIPKVAEDWTEDLTNYDFDPRIVEMEAVQITERYKRWHVLELGGMKEDKPQGVFRLMGGQINSASTKEVRDREIAQIERVWDRSEVDMSGFQELGQNWSKYPSSYRLASLFKATWTVNLIRRTTLTKGRISANTNQDVVEWLPRPKFGEGL